MKPLQKVAVFLFIIGLERGKHIFALMDSGEINAVVSEMKKLVDISQNIQQSVWTEFEQLGYQDTMNPSDTLGIIRLLFNGSRIGEKSRR